jgi:hypothetical protein
MQFLDFAALAVAHVEHALVAANLGCSSRDGGLQHVTVAVAQKVGHVGAVVVERVVHLDLVGVGNVPDQLAEALRGLACAEVAYFRRGQLDDGDDAVAA